MLVLMEQAPAIRTSDEGLCADTHQRCRNSTLAEVRWTRRLPFGKANGGAHFVGLKFMF